MSERLAVLALRAPFLKTPRLSDPLIKDQKGIRKK